MKQKEAYDIPIITESLAIKVKAGEITLHEATVKLYKVGWTFYVDKKETKKLLLL